jgi:rsbT co-antagonist protein RsbR
MNPTPAFPSATELAALRQRVAELEEALQVQNDLVAQLQANEAAQREIENSCQQLIELAPDAILVTDASGRIILVNRQTELLFGYARTELLDQPVEILMPASFRHHHVGHRDQYLESPYPRPMGANLDLKAVRKDGQEFCVEISLSPWVFEGQRRVVCTIRDITKQKEAERERQQIQEEIIQAQAAALHELSTPLIPISDNVMVMPLIGSIDTQRAEQVVETLLEGISSHRVAVAILDITGVPVVDTQVANTLIHAAQAVKLLGARVILTGIRPEVAQTLVGLGADLSSITTYASLQRGIASAAAHLG